MTNENTVIEQKVVVEKSYLVNKETFLKIKQAQKDLVASRIADKLARSTAQKSEAVNAGKLQSKCYVKRVEARAHNLFYGLLRGKRVDQIEASNKKQPGVYVVRLNALKDEIEELCKTYGVDFHVIRARAFTGGVGSERSLWR